MRYSLAYVRFVIAHRKAVMALVGLLTILAGYSLSQARFGSSVIKLFFGESERYDAYRTLADEFGESDVAFMVVSDDALLSEEGLARLEHARVLIEEHPDVRQVQAFSSANQIKNRDDNLEIYPYEAWFEENLGDEEALKLSLRQDRFVQGLLLSGDHRSAALLVELKVDESRTVERLPSVLASWEKTLADTGFDAATIRRAGMVAESVASTEQARFNIERLLPLTVLVLALVVFVMFLQLLPVAITVSVSLIALLWTFGVAVAVDPQINLMMAMVPAVMMVVCFSDIIHLISAYRLELERGRSKDEAIAFSGGEVGLACIYTSATTFVGFASLAFVPTPVFRNLGMALGLGVAIALGLAMTLVPIVFSYLPEPKEQKRMGSQRISAWVDGFAQGCRRLATHWPKATGAFFLGVAIFSIIGLSKFRVETSIVDRLDADHPIQQDRRFIAEHFSGTSFIDVYIELEGEDFKDPERLAQVKTFQERAQEISGITGALSLVDLISTLHDELKIGTKAENQDFPESRALIAQYLMLFENGGGGGLERVVDERFETMRLSLRLDHARFVQTHKTGIALQAMGQEIFGENVRISATGLNFLFGEWLEMILSGQKRGLMFAFVMTALMMMWILRSFAAGLVAMLPNVLPLMVLGGGIGWAVESIDSDSILLMMMAIGIAVDDTIHILTRLHLEAQRGGSIDAAMERTFTFAGRAIVQTTVILCMGFLPFASSDYFTTKMMGILLPVTLFLALFADLLLVPALVRLNILRISGPTTTSSWDQTLSIESWKSVAE